MQPVHFRPLLLLKKGFDKSHWSRTRLTVPSPMRICRAICRYGICGVLRNNNEDGPRPGLIHLTSRGLMVTTWIANAPSILDSRQSPPPARLPKGQAVGAYDAPEVRFVSGSSEPSSI